MENLTAVLREVPFLLTSSIQFEPRSKDVGADFIVSVQTSGPARVKALDRRLVCEVESSGQRRIAREACLSLAEFAGKDQRAYPVFIAPYISPAAAEICEEYKAGYLDFAGNCRLAFDTVVHTEGRFPEPDGRNQRFAITIFTKSGTGLECASIIRAANMAYTSLVRYGPMLSSLNLWYSRGEHPTIQDAATPVKKTTRVRLFRSLGVNSLRC